MNCNEFQEGFVDGRDLSKDANAHMSSCSICETFHDENLQLTQMISSLPSVEVPKDFEFGFKAKLAESQLNKPIAPFWRMLRYLLPLSAAVLIFGFIIINSNLFTPTENLETVQSDNGIEMKLSPVGEEALVKNKEPNKEITTANVPQNTKQKLVEKDDKKDKNQEQARPIIKLAENKKSNKTNDESDDEIITRDMISESDKSGILNKESALSIPDVQNPIGINPEKKINKTRINETAKSFTVQSILSQLGIETTNQGGSLKVNLVRAKSPSANSGVKVGDIVTAIDGQRVFVNLKKIRTVQGKSLTVKRGDKVIDLIIKNN